MGQNGSQQHQGQFEDLAIQERETRAKWIAGEHQRRCREVAAAIDSTTLAAVCGVSYQYIRAMLNSNGDQRPWQHEHDGALMILAPDLYAELVLNWLAQLVDREPPPKRKDLTPEERLAALESAIKQHGLQDLPAIKRWL
jgi:hypothetical protein